MIVVLINRLFCPHCSTYLGPSKADCDECGRERPREQLLPAPGQPYWTAIVPGAVVGQPFMMNGRLHVTWAHEPSREGGTAGGGLVGVDAISGEQNGKAINFDRPIRGRVALLDDLALITLGSRTRMGNGAVVAVSLSSGKQVWGPVELPGIVTHGPVVHLQRTYMGCGDGFLYCLDTLKSGIVWKMAFRAGDGLAAPPVVIATPQGVLVSTGESRGRLMLVTRDGARELWRFDDWIRSACGPIRKILFVVCEEGLYALDVGQAARARKLFDAQGGVLAEHAGTLYYGGRDHHLRALTFDGRERWTFAVEGTPSTPPVFGEGLAFFGDSHGLAYAVDVDNGAEVWRTRLTQPDTREPDSITGSILLDDGRLYVGTKTGRVVCLPWHLGQFARVAGRLDPGRAAVFWAAGADFSRLQSQITEYHEKAATCWEMVGELDKAARMWEAVGDWKRAAETYAEAARALTMTRSKEAAQLLVQAASLWNKLFWDGTPGGNEEAQRKREHILDGLNKIPGVRVPLLRVRLVNAPKFIERAAGTFAAEINNIGKISATQIRLTAGGGLVNEVDIELENHRPGDVKKHTFEIRPTQSGALRLDFHYRDFNQEYPEFQTTMIVPITVSEALVVRAGGVGTLNVIAKDVVLQTRDVGAVIARGGSIGSVKAQGGIGLVKSSAGRVCSECNADNSPTAEHCFQCGQRLT